MKKISILILILSLVFALTACGKNEEPTTQIANPWREITVDEMATLIDILPPVTENENYTGVVYRYNEAIELFEADFNYNGQPWTMRFQKADKAEDISGVYYEWPEDNNGFEKEITIGGLTVYQLSAVDEGNTVYVEYLYHPEMGCAVSLSTSLPEGQELLNPLLGE